MEPNITIKGRSLRIASLEDDLDVDIVSPEETIEMITRAKNIDADIFTFCQKPPDVAPMYDYYHMEWEPFAVLECSDYQHWFEQVLNRTTRNRIRKAEKMGVSTRLAGFDEELVRGIAEIYNESPVRQNRRFKHFGKSIDETGKANATHLKRSDFIGAYHDDELIGFIKLAYGDRSARLEQFITKLRHRDKAPSNALIAKAVELCARKGIRYLLYGKWPSSESLARFKRNNGFVRVDLPRYYVPLSLKGRVAVTLGLHRGIKQLVPGRLQKMALACRARWYRHRSRSG